MIARHRLPVRRYAMLLFLSFATTRAEAQSAPCTLLERTDPPGELLTCRDGLIVRTEQGSLYRLIDRNSDGHPEGAELTSRGLLIESEPARRRSRFQIHTPHAIASVRGTIWAVDVTPARTSVFVQRGAVAVRRQGSRQSVTLRVGEGVDVEGIGGPLEVKRWAPQRAAALLARFGR
jgi:FecR protein